MEADLYTVWLIEQLEPAFPNLSNASLHWKIRIFLAFTLNEYFLSIHGQLFHMIINANVEI